MKLTQQERAREADPQHMDLLNTMENGEPVELSDIQHYPVLSADDFNETNVDDWVMAPILVATNRERHNLIEPQCCRFAKAKNTHVIRWPAEHKQWEQKPRRPEHVEEAVKDPCFFEYYIAGADGFLTDNLCKQRRMANGTAIRYHSLVPANRNQKEQIESQVQSLPAGSIITLSEPPLAINVHLLAEETGRTEREKKRNIAAWQNLTLVKDRVVVPILPHRTKTDAWEQTIVPGGRGFLCSKVKVRCNFPIEPGFAITIHKAQGRTIRKVILAISYRSAMRCNMSYASLYVALSRIQKSDDLRLLVNGNDWSTVQYISSLEPDKSIKAFFAGFRRDPSKWNAADALKTYDDET